MKKSKRSDMPSKYKIYNYWKPRLIKLNKIHSEVIFNKPNDFCFVCGWETETQRAHILAISDGGSNCVSNLHCLCPTCHRQSEPLKGEVYWCWFHSISIELECERRWERYSKMARIALLEFQKRNPDIDLSKEEGSHIIQLLSVKG